MVGIGLGVRNWPKPDIACGQGGVLPAAGCLPTVAAVERLGYSPSGQMGKLAMFQCVVMPTEVSKIRDFGGAAVLGGHGVVDVATDRGSRATGKAAVLVSCSKVPL